MPLDSRSSRDISPYKHNAQLEKTSQPTKQVLKKTWGDLNFNISQTANNSFFKRESKSSLGHNASTLNYRNLNSEM